VLLPRGARGWSAERRDIVLLHELSHVRRRDGLGLTIAQLTCALYWFHPLAWLGVTRLRRECELYADEAVVESGIRATCYAEHLVDLAREMSGAPHAIAGAFGMAARPSELGRRIQILLSRTAAPPRLTRARTVLTSLGALALLSVVTSLEAAPEPTVERGVAQASQGELAAVGTFDARLQRIAEEEAAGARRDSRAARVAAVILDAEHGQVLAMADDEPGRPIPVASTLKPLTLALALDGGHITLAQRFDCGHGQRSYGPESSRALHDVGSHGWLDAGQILAVSSNIGTSRIFDALGGFELARGLARFQLETPAQVEDGSLEGALLAMGARVYATPVALAAAYGVLAHDGLYPSAMRTSTTEAPERVIGSATARTMRSLLEEAVYGNHATGRLAQVPGVRVAGKTGTTAGDEHVALFAGMLPAEAPRFVIVVAVSEAQQPGGGATLAAPVFARIGSRVMSQ
jgi:membrane carboxypeptidase/penicillin-binding protein PbpC